MAQETYTDLQNATIRAVLELEAAYLSTFRSLSFALSRKGDAAAYYRASEALRASYYKAFDRMAENLPEIEKASKFGTMAIARPNKK